MKHRIVVLRAAERTEILAEEGATIHESLAAAGATWAEAPCGGKGLCGKCRIRASGSLSEPGSRETAVLTAVELAAGIRLSCQARLLGEAAIERPEAGEAVILAAYAAASAVAAEAGDADPPAGPLYLSLPPASLESQEDDEKRLLRAIAALLPPDRAPDRLRLPALDSLARAAGGARDGSSGDGEVRLTAFVAADAELGRGVEVIAVEADDGPRRYLGVGVDIGTTTVACYLVDLGSGAGIAHRAALNDQRGFGADVISRIAATIEQEGGLPELRRRIVSQLDRMILSLVAEAGEGGDRLLSIVVAGNATMLHLFAGVSPAAIASSPFAPVFTRSRSCPASELGLRSFPRATLYLLPCVSAYVGADVVAGIAATGMAEGVGVSLLLDIGTNGEIALGGAGGILCCATAAGPAFEGAGIEKGMGGIEAAVDAVWLDGGELRFSTIGNKPALGICGSGLIDAVAAFLDCGLLDSSGRVVDAKEAALLPPAIAGLRVEGPKGTRLYLDRGRDLYLSQGDFRAAQLAKAAVAAGIDLLVAAAGLTLRDIDRVFLAGGFGSFLDERSALRIGLIPRELGDRILVAGNTSGAGAAAAAASMGRLRACGRARELCRYVELSSRADFNEAYVERMPFPERA